MRIALFSVLAAAISFAGDVPASAAVAPAIDAPATSGAAAAKPMREAAVVCGNTGCYTPQVHNMRRHKFQTLGRG